MLVYPDKLLGLSCSVTSGLIEATGGVIYETSLFHKKHLLRAEFIEKEM